MAGTPPTPWDTYWPRLLAILQAGLGTWGFAEQVTSGVSDPYLLTACILFVSGAPATEWAIKRLGGGPK